MTSLARIGFYVGGSAVTAVRQRAGGWTVTRHHFDDLSSIGSIIGAELETRDDASPVTVVLGRPVAHQRTVELAPMRVAMAERILARDWDRYFIAMDAGSHIVAARQHAPGAWSAAFAPASLVQNIDSALDGSAHITTTDAVLASIAPDAATSVVCALASDGWHVTLAQRGIPVAGRTLPHPANAEDIERFAGEQGATGAEVVLAGSQVRMAAVRAEIASRVLVRTVVMDDTLDTAGAVLAALATTAKPSVGFTSEVARQRARAKTRTRTAWIWAAAAVAVFMGSVLERQVAARQLADIRAQRVTISPRVATALATRDSIQRRADLLAALRDAESSASRTSGLLAAIALALPRDATVSSMAVSGDSLSIEGEAVRGAAVYEALRRVRELEQVTLAAPLTQERRADAGVADHFAFAARVRVTR